MHCRFINTRLLALKGEAKSMHLNEWPNWLVRPSYSLLKEWVEPLIL